jgi:ligand-binding SRPBCC domain-containing protein
LKFHFTQELNAPINQVARFFADVNNLKRITPSYPRMNIVASTTGVVQGTKFLLTLDFGLFTFRWVSFIEAVGSDGAFTDSFSGNLFRLWRHSHSFQAIPAGSLVIDDIECEPAWWLTPFAPVFVYGLFFYRRRALRSIFS